MPTPLVTLLGLFAVLMAAGAIVTYFGYRRAPDGEEDATGFRAISRPPAHASGRSHREHCGGRHAYVPVARGETQLKRVLSRRAL